jgi:hypothetical protein
MPGLTRQLFLKEAAMKERPRVKPGVTSKSRSPIAAVYSGKIFFL